MKKRILAMLLVACMLVGIGSETVYAAEVEVTEPKVAEVIDNAAVIQSDTGNVRAAKGSTLQTNISVNTSYSGQLNEWNDVRQYQFTLSKAGVVSISFSHKNLLDTGRYWVARIFNEDTNSVVQLDSSGTDTSKTSTEVGLPAGLYYVQIESDASYRNHDWDWKNHNTATYTFKLNYTVSSTWEKEENESYEEANEVSLNTSYKGAIQFWDDEDYYKFTLSNAGKVSISFSHKNLMDTGRYWVVRIFNTKTEEEVQLDSSGTDTSKKSAEVGLPAGTYYLRIESDASYRNHNWDEKNHNTATYTFQLNFTASNIWETETNDSYEEADKVSLNTTYSGVNQYWSDVDYYTFTLSKGENVNLNFKHPQLSDSGRYWVLRLFNDRTEELMKLDIMGNETSTNSGEISLSAGTYYIKLESDASYRNHNWDGKNHNTATYQFKVSYYFNETKPSLKAIPTAYNKIKLTQNKVSSSSGYTIYRSTSKNGTYKAIKDIFASSSRQYTDSGLSAGKTYYYKVRGYRKISGKKYYSKYSSVVSAKAAPTKTTISSVKAGKKKATITWKRQSGISGYEVLMSTKKNSGYKTIKIIKKASTVKYTKTGLKKGKTYYFKVRTHKTVNGKKVYGGSSNIRGVKITKQKQQGQAVYHRWYMVCPCIEYKWEKLLCGKRK